MRACRTRTDADVVIYHAKNAKRCAFGAAVGETVLNPLTARWWHLSPERVAHDSEAR